MKTRRVFAKNALVSVFVFFSALSGWAQTAERYVLAERPSALVRAFNVSDNAEVSSARAGVSPDGLVVSPNGRLAFVANLNGNYVSVIDLTINAEMARLHNMRARHLALNADGSRLVVPISFTTLSSDRVEIVDTSTLQLIQSVSVNGLVGDDPGNSSDIGLEDVVVVGSKVYVNTGFSGFPNRLIAVVDLNSFTVSAVTGSGIGFATPSSSMAATPDGGHVVALRVGPRRLLVIDTATNTVVQGLDPGARPLAIAITRDAADPDGVFGYLVRAASPGIIDVINPTTGQILSSAALPFSTLSPASENIEIALTADGNRAYVVSADLNETYNLAVVDTGLLLSNPAGAVISQFRVGNDLRAVDVAFTQALPPGTAPTVGSVAPDLVVNDTATTVHVTGSGFAVDARVRIGSLDPVAATVLSSSDLEAGIPTGAPAQGADVIVTNPNSLGPVSDQHQSGILRGQLVIASPPVFQPAHQVLVTHFGEGTLAVLNISTDTTLPPKLPIGTGPLSLAITPDGERAYVHIFQPPALKVLRIPTSQVETSIPFSSEIRLGQLDGIAVAPHPVTGKPVAYVVDGVIAGPGFDERLNVVDADPTSPTFNTIIDTLQAGLSNGQAIRGSLATTPDGRFVYCNSFIQGVSTNTDGRLVIFDVVNRTATIHTASALGVFGFQPGLQVTSDGQSLVTLGNTGTIKVFDIGADPLNPSLVATITGTPPPGVPFLFLAPSRVVGNRLFGFDNFENVLQVFNFDRTTPDFSQLGSITIPGAAGGIVSGMAVTPDGALVYVVQLPNDAIAVVDAARLIAGDPAALLTRIGVGLGPAGIAVRPGTPTATGTSVPVQPIQEVMITFDTVTSGGGTTATTTYTNPNPTPAGFAVGNPPIYYEINTTATFSGPIEVCFSYDETQFTGPEGDLRVLHEEDGTFVDRTVSLDTLNNIICAQVDSFSSFVVGLGSVDFLFDTLLEAINNAVAHPGLRRALRALVLAARDARDRDDSGAAIQQLNAFKEQVQAQSGKNISEMDAERLISLADSLISRF